MWGRFFNNMGLHLIVVFQLIYTCALRENVGVSELDNIAETSRIRNMTMGLTGILFCKDGSILQILEGEESIVENLYEKISKDTRISNALVLIRRQSDKREFPNWSMGYRNASKDPASFELTIHSFRQSMPDEQSPELDTIGTTFARVNGLT